MHFRLVLCLLPFFAAMNVVAEEAPEEGGEE